MTYIIGQILGLVSTVCTIILPFFQKKWQILSLNIGVNVCVASNLLLIGQFGSGAFLCMVAIVQSIVSMYHSVKNTPIALWEQILFFIMYVGSGVFGIVTAPGFVMEVNRQNLLELLPIIGALLLMFSVFAKDEQTLRKFLLGNAIVWTVYTSLVGSTAFFTDLVAAVSTASALYKYRRRKE